MLSRTLQQHFSTLSFNPFQPEEELLLVLMEMQSRAAQEKREAWRGQSKSDLGCRFFFKQN